MRIAEIAVVVGYLFGSIPFAHLVARWRGIPDLRRVGNGNIGARNVWHVVGPWWGVLVFALDAAKGAVPVLLSRALDASPTAIMLAGLAAVLGHDYPLYTRFRAGGKGLSATVGVLVAWMPLPGLVGVVVWGAAHALLRNLDRSTYAAAIAAIALPLAFGHPWWAALYALALFLLILVRKLQDRARQRRVWVSSGWGGVSRDDWYGAAEVGEGPRTGLAP
ncbi:MAG: glycerol-3-phosphate acyltransferase [Anaerolineae bacterium]|nr:glycerol-3-phosphate acyltransferase [Anaerolineae bacterium]